LVGLHIETRQQNDKCIYLRAISHNLNIPDVPNLAEITFWEENEP